MSRFGLVLMAVAAAAGAVGCTQCDTCDDFPTPCIGPNCGNRGGATAGTYTTPVMAASPYSAGPASAVVEAPAIGSTEAAPASSNGPTVVPPAETGAGAGAGPAAESSPPAPMSPGAGGAFTKPSP